MAGNDNSSRAKLLGELIENARTHARRTVEECAQVMHISPQEYQKVEKGEHAISLPDLEALAIYLNVPMGYFWGTAALQAPPEIDYDSFTALRHRVIGVLLRQLRIQARKSHKDLAKHLGVDEAQIIAYEMGQTPIPYLHLEQLSQYLGESVEHFIDDQRGPLARHEARQKLLKQFERMAPDMQAFIINPVNLSYLETAKRISEMDVEKLRQVAENILDITY